MGGIYLKDLPLPDLIERARAAVVGRATRALRADPAAPLPYIVLDLPCTFFALRALRWGGAWSRCVRPFCSALPCTLFALSAFMRAPLLPPPLRRCALPECCTPAASHLRSPALLHRPPPHVRSYPAGPASLAARSALPVVTEVARSLAFSPRLHALADRVVEGVTDGGRLPFNGVHLRVEKDARDWASIMGGQQVGGDAAGGAAGRRWVLQQAGGAAILAAGAPAC